MLTYWWEESLFKNPICNEVFFHTYVHQVQVEFEKSGLKKNRGNHDY